LPGPISVRLMIEEKYVGFKAQPKGYFFV
jgi:hypothetical protein